MNELLAQFIAEARDLLQEAGEDLLTLERAPADDEAINRLFRSIHTLKGSSGLFEVQALTRTLHAAEDVFQEVRERTLKVTPELVDLALKVLDQVGKWIEALEQLEMLPADADHISGELVSELREGFGSGGAGALVDALMPTARIGASVSPAKLNQWFGAHVLADIAAECSGVIRLISYVPEEGCFYKGEDPLHLAMQIPDMLAFGVEDNAEQAGLSDFDPFNSHLGYHALSMADLPELDELFRCVPEQVTITELSAAALIEGNDGDDAASSLPAVVKVLLREQIDLLEIDAAADELAGRIGAAGAVAINVMRVAGRARSVALLQTALARALFEQCSDALGAAMAELLGEVAVDAVADVAVAEVASVAAIAESGEKSGPRTLRVDQQKIDMLMNLIGELVVAKNSLPFLARRAEQQYGSRELSYEIKDQYGVIDRIAQELQGAVMSVRMMPVGQVFQRFPRLVRDLARKLGKQVDLVIEGEETEADKNVIESLFDPLLHMVRNSLDHGVESPEQRAACGKPLAAKVRLLARRDGDQVVIEVVDDGRGIDPEVIKRKAYERGMIDEDRLASISDHDASMLIFAAGFSTASTISDVSGRGVGMDVVRNAVEKAGGRIAMSSVKGEGTTLRIDLPLSMAVSRVMTVALGANLFGVPMDLIDGIVKIPRDDIASIKGCEAFVLRGRVLPLVRLASLLELTEVAATGDEIAVLVVRINGQTIGLAVSAFGEGMEVILKPLDGMLSAIAGYAGTALLGDGRVLLVLDLKELL